ncbi:MAG TPA: PPK2 family polyphosphate--nucleotide phosphotransferase [Pseudomonadaceae bacterium]|nr:PPK2 family polyphosphate--nucleotide phosphotransferase [Pseudomonadaceae bacterium]
MPFGLEYAQQFFVRPGFGVTEVDPSSTPGEFSAEGLAADFAQYDGELADLQENLWANAAMDVPGTGSLLLVVQGMDTSGKGGLIKCLGRVIHPRGLKLTAFGKPTAEEASQDFLERIRPALPAPGEIAVFDRSHYEDVLVQKVERYAGADEIERRYGAIRDFEEEVVGSGTRIIKIMLHISREFQYKNLHERLTKPKKYWKFDRADLTARSKWEQYMSAYQIAMERTSTRRAPWYCIPGDNKAYARVVVKHLLVGTLRELRQGWPPLLVDPNEALQQLNQS